MSENNVPRTTRARYWKWIQIAFVITALVYATVKIQSQWAALQASASNVRPNWWQLIGASMIVLATYVALIQSWRLLIAGWGSHIPFGIATRIWTISNLGRYVPGKVWSIGAMGVMAQQAGVSPAAAAGSAVLGTLLNIGIAFGVVAVCLMASSADLLASLPSWMRAVAVAGNIVFIIGILAAPWVLPAIVKWFAARLGRTIPQTSLPATTLWMAVSINGLAWFTYGLAFMVFTHAIFPGVAGGPIVFVALFTVPYVAGYLALIAPGGIGVREVILLGMLTSLNILKAPDAAVLVAASRVWLTVLEVVPGVVALLLTQRSTTISARRG